MVSDAIERLRPAVENLSDVANSAQKSYGPNPGLESQVAEVVQDFEALAAQVTAGTIIPDFKAPLRAFFAKLKAAMHAYEIQYWTTPPKK